MTEEMKENKAELFNLLKGMENEVVMSISTIEKNVHRLDKEVRELKREIHFNNLLTITSNHLFPESIRQEAFLEIQQILEEKQKNKKNNTK